MPPAQKPMRSTSSRAGDLTDRVDGRQNAPGVVVEVPVALFLGRVAPAEHERLQPAADRVLDEAAAGPQIEEVVPADRRRHDEHRASLHGLGRRLVLDDLADRLSIDDRAGSDGQIPCRPGTRCGRPSTACRRCAARRRAKFFAPRTRLSAARLERALDGRRVAEQRVGRRSGALHHVEQEAGGDRLTSVAAQIVEHLVGELAAGQVALTDPTVDRVVRTRPDP